jgi:hypothetical protein
MNAIRSKAMGGDVNGARRALRGMLEMPESKVRHAGKFLSRGMLSEVRAKMDDAPTVRNLMLKNVGSTLAGWAYLHDADSSHEDQKFGIYLLEKMSDRLRQARHDIEAIMDAVDRSLFLAPSK